MMERRFVFVAVLLMVAVCSCNCGESSRPASPAVLKAAIIDQFSLSSPNPQFNGGVSSLLNEFGLQVTYYETDKISVDFFRKLPAAGYKVIVIRMHTGLLGNVQGDVAQGTYIMTSEPYNKNRYIIEQLGGQVAMARVSDSAPYVFAINSKFVTKSMAGKFPGSVVIMMGCATTYNPDLAAAFIAKGASAFVGWDGNLDLTYADQATLSLIKNLLSPKLTVAQAIRETVNEVGPEPFFNARLTYQPALAGLQTVAALIH